MKLSDLLLVCEDKLILDIWNAENNQYLGSYNGSDKIGFQYFSWDVVKIQGSGKGFLMDVLIKEK